MYFGTHAAISLAVPAVISASAGHAPGLTILAAGLIGGVAIDVVDHTLYQVRFARRDPQLRNAWAAVRNRQWRRAIALFTQIEDSRAINRLVLHSRGGLIAASVLAVIIGLTVETPWVLAAVLTYLLSMHCDIVWDWKIVGHARNWFGRPTMRGTANPRAIFWWLRHFRLFLTTMYFAVMLIAGDFFLSLGDSRRNVLNVVGVQIPASWILGYLTALGMITYVCGSRARAAGRDVPLLETRLRHPESGHHSVWLLSVHFLRVNHIVTAGLLMVVVTAEVVTCLSVGETLLQPATGLFGPATLPFFAAVLVLTTSLLTTYFVHSTAGALGGLAGAAIGTAVSYILVPDAPGSLGTTVLATVLVSATLSWALGILFLRLPGPRVTSYSVLVGQLTEAAATTIPLGAFREHVRRAMAKVARDLMLPTQDLGQALVVSTDNQLRIRSLGKRVPVGGGLAHYDCAFSPRNVASWPALLPTFASRTDLSFPPLAARTQPAGYRHRRRNASELLDSLLTVRARLRVHAKLAHQLGTDSWVIRVEAFEETSTKVYCTAYSDRLVLILAARLATVASGQAAIATAQYKQSMSCPHVLGAGRGRVVSRGNPAASDLLLVDSLTGHGSTSISAVRRATQRLSVLAVQVVSIGGTATSIVELFRLRG